MNIMRKIIITIRDSRVAWSDQLKPERNLKLWTNSVST